MRGQDRSMDGSALPRLDLGLSESPGRPVPGPRSAAAFPPTSRTATVPAGAAFRGSLRAEAIEIRGHVTGEIVCGFGPLVIRGTGGLEGWATAKGDVQVAGVVTPGQPEVAPPDVISTPGRLVLLPGASVRGDVRCGTIEIHEGAALLGVARGHPSAR